ncbi:MAG: DUF397 domain-containing protein [Streptosporangiales bacterium]|nr:DUF397 domain-containing protein [Streptosporangiales bacterium]
MSKETNWRKASYSGSGGGNCVEAGDGDGRVLVRDTKQRASENRAVLAVDASAWRRFTGSLKHG